MKIKVIDKPFAEVKTMTGFKYEKPIRQNAALRWLIKMLSAGELKSVNFKCEKTGMEKLSEDEPCLVLMNHSAFIDLKIAASVIYPKQFHIVTTIDGFVGKNSLMRHVGCIPARKFIADSAMVADIVYSLRRLKSSVLMYPEASYSFDGTQTPLPRSVGKALKLFNVPVIMIRTYGAFLHDPLYNGLRLRKVDVSAEVKYLLSTEDIRSKSVQELNDILKENFTFDNFAWQKEQHVCVNEPFRAEGLERVLYKCPHCMAEGKMVSSGTHIRCSACGAEYELTEYGDIKEYERDIKTGKNKNDVDYEIFPECKTKEMHEEHEEHEEHIEVTEDFSSHRSLQEQSPSLHFSSIPEWYSWERTMVKHELENKRYRMETPVRIMVLINTDAIYHVGDGTLIHDESGFRLDGCDGELSYEQSPRVSYSVYADYFWYEIGDMICIGTPQMQYYCFPMNKDVNVAKVRLAAEEMYKMHSL